MQSESKPITPKEADLVSSAERSRCFSEPGDQYANKPIEQCRVIKSESMSTKASSNKLAKPITHFVCMVANADKGLTSNLEAIQDLVVNQFGLPSQVKVNVRNDLHITWMVLSLKDEESEERVLEAIEKTKHLGPQGGIGIKFSKIDRFDKRVMWVRPLFDDESAHRSMLEWRRATGTLIEDLICDGKRAFTPHATIMKTSNLRKLAHTVAFTADMVTAANLSFVNPTESQVITEITLMSCKKDHLGQYIRRGSVSFPQ